MVFQCLYGVYDTDYFADAGNGHSGRTGHSISICDHGHKTLASFAGLLLPLSHE
jgi:hypothetical protein